MKKILALSEKHAFMRPVWNGSDVSHFKFGPAGEFLVNNIRQEWFSSSVTNQEENVFPFHSGNLASNIDLNSIKEPFDYVKGLSNGQLPFGLAETCLVHGPQHSKKNEGGVFSPEHRTILRSLMFMSPSDASQYFYNWQQKRKMWWRKFSAYPGRFSLSDIKEISAEGSSAGNEGTHQEVHIRAEFEWGSTNIETVLFYSSSILEQIAGKDDDFKVRDGRKAILPCIVESRTSLETASFVFLCDAFSEPSTSRTLLRLHRRLAPYKVSFVASLKEASVGEKLRELASHLSNTLRRAGHSTLLLPDMARKSLESQLSRNDEIGIPFTIVLQDSTLADGIIRLYSRETTLKEQVHISQLQKYMDLLMKNY